MDNVKGALEKETEKMAQELKKEMDGISYDKKNKQVADEVTNLLAYISDCSHFRNKGDPIRAFEAIVFAWGIFECLKNIHLIE